MWKSLHFNCGWCRNMKIFASFALNAAADWMRAIFRIQFSFLGTLKKRQPHLKNHNNQMCTYASRFVCVCLRLASRSLFLIETGLASHSLFLIETELGIGGGGDHEKGIRFRFHCLNILAMYGASLCCAVCRTLCLHTIQINRSRRIKYNTQLKTFIHIYISILHVVWTKKKHMVALQML